MNKIDQIKVTPGDKKAYPYHTDDTIKGIKFIKSIPSDQLLAYLEAFKATKHIPFRDEFGSDTNPRWILGRIADELYDRQDLDDKDYDLWNRLIG